MNLDVISRIAMDAASSEWKSEKAKAITNCQRQEVNIQQMKLIEHWANLCEKYPIISIRRRSG